MQTLKERWTEPLCGHADMNACIAIDAQRGPVTVRQWLAEVHALAQAWPSECQHVLNVCQSRYHFLLVFAAGLLTKRISLQPSSLAPTALTQLLKGMPHAMVVHDGYRDALPESLLTLDLREVLASTGKVPAVVHEIPRIDAEQVASYVYTSGSTGQPVAHRKTWGRLCLNARAGAACLRLSRWGQPVHIVGTVPSQHMYGFEATVLLPLVAGHRLVSGKPFYPADVADALKALPEPRMLVTTPAHLRVLVESDEPQPPVQQLMCATAPLGLDLAVQAEARFEAPLHEIYGCTETGQIASRRTTEGPLWRLFPDVQLAVEGDTTWAWGGHVEGRQALADVLELNTDGGFLLRGRKADLVNIAGKRSSLAYLNEVLLQIPGVQDGVFFLPETPAQAVAHPVERLCLVVQAPGLSAAQVQAALRQRIDDVFLPRPLIPVSRMPRNETGKLTRQALQALFDQHRDHSESKP